MDSRPLSSEWSRAARLPPAGTPPDGSAILSKISRILASDRVLGAEDQCPPLLRWSRMPGTPEAPDCTSAQPPWGSTGGERAGPSWSRGGPGAAPIYDCMPAVPRERGVRHQPVPTDAIRRALATRRGRAVSAPASEVRDGRSAAGNPSRSEAGPRTGSPPLAVLDQRSQDLPRQRRLVPAMTDDVQPVGRTECQSSTLNPIFRVTW